MEGNVTITEASSSHSQEGRGHEALGNNIKDRFREPVFGNWVRRRI